MILAGATPRLLAHIVDKEQFSEANIPVEYHVGWEDTQRMIKEMLRNCHKIAMEYSPNRSIPAISWADGGALELIRSLATIFSALVMANISCIVQGIALGQGHLCRPLESTLTISKLMIPGQY